MTYSATIRYLMLISNYLIGVVFPNVGSFVGIDSRGGNVDCAGVANPIFECWWSRCLNCK